MWILVLVGSLYLNGCATLRCNIKYSNPCPEYNDLLAPIYQRYKSPDSISELEESDRMVCLQGWVRKYVEN